MAIGKESTGLRRACVEVAASAMFYSGALNLLRPTRDRTPGGAQDQKPDVYPFAVLLYHRVNPDADPFSPALSVNAFDAQMKYLADHFQVLPLSEIVEKIRLGSGVGRQTIAVTFDDGYRDNYVYAHPVLRKYNLPATLFAATSYIGTEEAMWNDKIALAVKRTSRQNLALPGTKQSLSLASIPERLWSLEEVLENLKTLPELDKQSVVAEILEQLGNKEMNTEPAMLSWAELKILAREGWEVGSHTACHVILTRVPLSEAKEEIKASAALLEHELERPVRLFAYPNGKPGDYDASIKNFLKDAGYIGAVSTVDRLNDGTTDLFEICRKSPWEESLASFALRLNWSYWRAAARP